MDVFFKALPTKGLSPERKEKPRVEKKSKLRIYCLQFFRKCRWRKKFANSDLEK